MEHAEGYAALLADDRTAPYISDQGVLARAAAVAKLQQIAPRGITDPTQIHFAIVRGGVREFLGYVAAHDLRGGICPISYAVLPPSPAAGCRPSCPPAVAGLSDPAGGRSVD